MINNIDLRQVLVDVRPHRKTIEYTGACWGFMLYVSRYKTQHYGVVCKIVDPKDMGDTRRRNFTYPPGQGIIIRDTNRNDSRILSNDPVTFIMKEFPEEIQSRTDTQLQRLRSDNSRIEYCAMIELFLRKKDRCLSQDIVWLRYS